MGGCQGGAGALLITNRSKNQSGPSLERSGGFRGSLGVVLEGSRSSKCLPGRAPGAHNASPGPPFSRPKSTHTDMHMGMCMCMSVCVDFGTKKEVPGRHFGGILGVKMVQKSIPNRDRNSRAKKEAFERDLASIWELPKGKKYGKNQRKNNKTLKIYKMCF